MLVVAFGKPDETVVLTDAGPDGSVTYYRDETTSTTSQNAAWRT